MKMERKMYKIKLLLITALMCGPAHSGKDFFLQQISVNVVDGNIKNIWTYVPANSYFIYKTSEGAQIFDYCPQFLWIKRL